MQDPHGFYDRASRHGRVIWWSDYGMPALLGHAEVSAALKDRRLQRVPPTGLPPFPNHLRDFGAVEALSLLSLEGGDHARLRGQVLRAFKATRVAALKDDIEAICHALIDAFPDEPSDLVAAYTSRVPVIVIARLLGMADDACDRLLAWSHAMVAVYRPTVSRSEEDAANRAVVTFTTWLNDLIENEEPNASGLLSAQRTAQDEGRLSRAETLATAILLLNAGHEATVHALGLAVVRLIGTGDAVALTRPAAIAAMVEVCLRLDAPLHVFTRWVHGRVTLIALSVLFDRLPGLRLSAPPHLAEIYHFHGYQALVVET